MQNTLNNLKNFIKNINTYLKIKKTHISKIGMNNKNSKKQYFYYKEENLYR